MNIIYYGREIAIVIILLLTFIAKYDRIYNRDSVSHVTEKVYNSLRRNLLCILLLKLHPIYAVDI